MALPPPSLPPWLLTMPRPNDVQLRRALAQSYAHTTPTTDRPTDRLSSLQRRWRRRRAKPSLNEWKSERGGPPTWGEKERQSRFSFGIAWALPACLPSLLLLFPTSRGHYSPSRRRFLPAGPLSAGRSSDMAVLLILRMPKGEAVRRTVRSDPAYGDGDRLIPDGRRDVRRVSGWAHMAV